MGASLLSPRGRVTITLSGQGGSIYISTSRKLGFPQVPLADLPRAPGGPRGFGASEFPSSEFAYMVYFLTLPSGAPGRDSKRFCLNHPWWIEQAGVPSQKNQTTRKISAKRKILERKEKRGRRWSGLSESNRHLNLGKVPYYHYTKAADYNFYSTLPPETTRRSTDS